MGKIQYDLGKDFELSLCSFFSMNDYYVIYNEKSIAGSQPCDMIVIRNNIATLIECKNLENKTGIFNFNRIESNQWLAYNRFKRCKNRNMILAILWNNDVYFIDFGLLQFYEKSIDLKKFEPNIKTFYEVRRK